MSVRVAIVAAALAVSGVFGLAAQGQTHADLEEFEDWCDDRGGEVVVTSTISTGPVCVTGAADLERTNSTSIEEWRQQHGGEAT